MKNLIVNLIAKLAGIKSLLDKTKGLVTYTAGAGLILCGAGLLLGDASSLIASQDIPSILAFVKAIMSHAGTMKILEGLGLLGLRRAVAS